MPAGSPGEPPDTKGPELRSMFLFSGQPGTPLADLMRSAAKDTIKGKARSIKQRAEELAPKLNIVPQLVENSGALPTLAEALADLEGKVKGEGANAWWRKNLPKASDAVIYFRVSPGVSESQVQSAARQFSEDIHLPTSLRWEVSVDRSIPNGICATFGVVPRTPIRVSTELVRQLNAKQVPPE